MTKHTYFLLAVVLPFVGCGSEVDKCVESQVRAWTDASERTEAYWDEKQRQMRKAMNSNEWEIVREKDIRTRNEVEAEARLTCLSIASRR